MEKDVTNWLQIKVISGMAALLIGAAAIFFYLGLLTERNHANLELLSYVKQLDVQGEAIKRRGITYANHAPRDYAPYFRDVVIFYPDFMKDLDAFNKQIGIIAEAAQHLPGTDDDNNVIINSIDKLQTSWDTFRQGLQEKLGDDLKEPRLEWGADYVKENQQLINSITGSLIVTIENTITQQLEANRKLSVTALSGAGILLLLGVTWFYFSVIRRVGQTIAGCRRVAQGDFGYQLPVTRNDELGALASAFNTLSARTRFVLTMLTKMHRHGSAENKIDSLWTEAAGYLPVQWLGLWQMENNSLNLMTMRSERPMRTAMQESLVNAATHDRYLLSLCEKSASPVKFSDLARDMSTLPDATLLREIIKLGLLNSAMIVPLTSDDGWQGLLIFIAGEPGAYSDEQLELMGNLAPFMANGFAQAAK